MRYDNEDMPSGICDDCGDACCATMQDFGIGSYEYWGSRGVHHDWQAASPCCGAAVVEGGVKVIERKTHKARKEHGRNIKPGDRYERTLLFHWRTDGPGWFTVNKRKLAA